MDGVYLSSSTSSTKDKVMRFHRMNKGSSSAAINNLEGEVKSNRLLFFYTVYMLISAYGSAAVRIASN